MKFPGHMTAKEALARRFTHHGRYFGIPVWLAPDDPDFPVATKWAPMEAVMSLFMAIESFIRPILFAGEEACFQFEVLHIIIPSREKL